MDKASILGITIGVFAIVGTLIFESNSLLAIIQPTAALIVIGGTLGATFLNFSMNSMQSAFNSIKKVFTNEKENSREIIQEIISLATIVRQDGILALQDVIPEIRHDFLRKGIQLVVDINNPQFLQEILVNEMNLEEEEQITNSRIFEAMGGFAPTFGIIGAVLGLIQVMRNLQDPSDLGQGIATAFVATFYGVGLANLFLLPIAGKLKMKLREEILLKEMMIHGLLSIHAGENPALIQEKLVSFINYVNRQSNSVNYRSEEVIL